MTTSKGGSRQRWIVLAASAVAVVAIVGSGLVLANADSSPTAPQPSAASSIPRNVTSAPQPPNTSAAEQAASVASPTALSIPSIGINHALATVGLNADGTLQVPSLADVAVPAWYTGSPKPGAPGPAVIVGHVDSAASGAGVFFKLGALHVGDDIAVARADGITVHFTVTQVESVPKASFPTQAVYGNTVDSELRIITCGGQFDRSTGHYLNNIIVFAKYRA